MTSPEPKTIDEQMETHRVLGLCFVALLRRGGGPPGAVVGAEIADLQERLYPGLTTVWPDHPELDRANPLAFLEELSRRAHAHLESLEGVSGFVPAAQWEPYARDLFLEHLKAEVDAVVGGYLAEGLWQAFVETADTEPLAELVETGLLIKLRVVEGFLCLPPSRFKDELNASEFFVVDEWFTIAGEDTIERLVQEQKFLHKQTAHLTATRPLPEDKQVYRASTYHHRVERLLALLRSFTDSVDERLLPDWWKEWVEATEARMPKPLY